MNNNMDNDTYDYLYRIILIGDKKVGKYNIIQRFAFDQIGEHYPTRMSIEFWTKIIETCNKKKIKLQIFEQNFNFLSYSFYKGMHLIVMVYDVTNSESFNKIKLFSQSNKYSDNSDNSVLKVLVGNKIDLESKREITYEDGEKLANELGIPFYETSIITNKQINKMFDEVTELVYEKNKDNI